MERESVVRAVSADIPGEAITAHYFVESGVIHANIAGRMLLSAVGNCSPGIWSRRFSPALCFTIRDARMSAKPDWHNSRRHSGVVIARPSPFKLEWFYEAWLPIQAWRHHCGSDPGSRRRNRWGRELLPGSGSQPGEPGPDRS